MAASRRVASDSFWTADSFLFRQINTSIYLLNKYAVHNYYVAITTSFLDDLHFIKHLIPFCLY